MELKNIKVIVGLSGGVDSSVAALLLKLAGFDVRGVYLKCYWTYEGCQSDQDRNSAARVASVLNIPFEVWDFEKEYREKVVDYFYDEYKKGRTPNPDVVCNREIKFGLFLKEALKLQTGPVALLSRPTSSAGCSRPPVARRETHPERHPSAEGFTGTSNNIYIATGHYARIGFVEREVRSKKSGVRAGVIFPKFSQYEDVHDNDGIRYVGIEEYLELLGSPSTTFGTNSETAPRFSLFGGVDGRKDQSYFLYDMPQGAYEHILYPLGSLTKAQVREIAKKENLPTAGRPDSSGICFIGEVNIEKFLKEKIPESRGDVIDKKGNVIGEHKGIQFYTVGQRHGFRIFNFQFSIFNQISNPNDQKGNKKLPYYVIGKNVERNELVVGMGEECKSDQFSVKINRNLKFEILNFQLFVRIRNLGEMIPCKVISEKDKSNKLEVTLAYPVFGVAPGQSAVFYRSVNSRYGMQNGRCLSEVKDSDSAKPRLRTAEYRFDASTAYLHDVSSTVVWEVVGGGVIMENGEDRSKK